MLKDEARDAIQTRDIGVWARRRDSCIMAGVIQSEIMRIEDDGVGHTWPSQGNGAPGGSVGSREKA